MCLLKSTNAEYKDTSSVPFSIEFADYDSLEPRIKNKVSKYTNLAKNGKVAIMTPDINYIEPLYVATESNAKNSFTWANHPDNAKDNPVPPIITGEESFQQTSRTITGSNRYKEKQVTYSSQESGFLTSANQVFYREVLGRPPEASTRKSTWEKSDVPNNRIEFNADEKIKKYKITSDLSRYVEPGGSASYEAAETLNEALLGAKTDLQIKDIQGNTTAKTISFFYPTIRDGDSVTSASDRFAAKGKWIVKSASWTLKYEGSGSKILSLSPMIVCDGTQLSLGLLRSRSVDFDIEEIPIPKSPPTSAISRR